MLAKILNPFWWFGFFGFSFRWWLTCELFSIAVLPLCFYIFRALKDRGYGAAKIFGVFFVTYLNWYLCTVFSFSFGSVLISLIIAAGINAIFFFRLKDRILSFFTAKWKMILIYEIVFLLSFLFFVNVRSYRPEAMFNPGESGAEKMLNCAYLHGLMRTKHFPPRDTWLWGEYAVEKIAVANSGDTREKMIEGPDAGGELKKKKFYINYYYFGHLQWATLAKFSRYEARYAFNLGLATIFALSFLGAFSLGANMTRRYKWGFLAAFMVALFGNIDALQQLLERLMYWISNKGAGQTVWQSISSHNHLIFYSVDFWRTSRVIEDTVTEFPYFSAILGDLHPHHSCLPLVLLAMGTGMSFLVTVSRKSSSLKQFFERYWIHFLFFALVIGGTFVTNTWDAIIMGFFGAGILVYLNLHRWKHTWRGLWQSIVMVAGLGILSLILFLLFKLYFQPPMTNEIRIASWFPLKFKNFQLMIKPLPSNLHTDLTDYFVLFGLFLIPVLIYFIGIIRNYFSQKEPLIRWTWAIIALFFLVFSRNAFTFWLPGASIVFLSLITAFMIQGKGGRSRNYFYILCFVVGFFTLFVETLFIDDRMTGTLERYNTLFKIYYPIWSFLAICATYAFGRMFRKAILLRSKQRIALLSLFLALIVYVGMLYPVQSTGVRTDFFQTKGIYETNPELRRRTLDATEYMHLDKTHNIDIGGNRKANVNLKDDAGIIEWIRQNVKDQPVVLEAVGGCYVPFSRISSMTGLPTLIGWSHHVAQHRGGSIFDILGPREEDVKRIYGNDDEEQSRKLLKKYNVRYVMVGSLEKAQYSGESLRKFADYLKPVVEKGESILYEVPWDVPGN
jgi:YYY domain-containing protein